MIDPQARAEPGDGRFPEEVLQSFGRVGQRLSEIDAAEGAAGNISLFIPRRVPVEERFEIEERVELPVAVPELSGGTLFVSGSGQRLREFATAPERHIGCLRVSSDGKMGELRFARARSFVRLTSELNSHLAIHAELTRANGQRALAVLHAQPLHLTFLSHHPHYRDSAHLNRRVLCWQAEAILNLPEGIGVVPFLVPGSEELMVASAAAARAHRLVLWSQHGVVARAPSLESALDLIEYAEAGARYECLNLTHGGLAAGLTVEQIRAVCGAYGVEQRIF